MEILGYGACFAGGCIVGFIGLSGLIFARLDKEEWFDG